MGVDLLGQVCRHVHVLDRYGTRGQGHLVQVAYQIPGHDVAWEEGVGRRGEGGKAKLGKVRSGNKVMLGSWVNYGS